MNKLRFLRQIVLAGIVSLSGPLATAATFNVNSTLDAVDTTPGDGTCATSGAVCTLRAAVEEANAFAGSDTVNLPAGTYILTLNNDIDISAGSNVTITGAGKTLAIVDGNAGDRVFVIATGGTLTLTDLTVRDGSTAGDGGGVLNEGTLTLNRVIVRDNTADEGGGVWSRDGTAVLNATDTSFIDNTAGSDGGAAYVRDGTASFTRVTFNGNDSGRDGGGIYTRGNTTSISSSTFSANNASDDGGGFYIQAGTATTVNTTYYRNTTGDDGDNIRVQGGTASFLNTLADNNNSANNCSGTITSSGGNFAYGSGCTGFTSGDPLLASLADNGGETETHALGAGSPAIDAGTNSSCPATDQRGIARPQDGDGNFSFICDPGAYELVGAPVTGTDLGVSITDDQDPVNLTALVTYMITVTSTGTVDATGVTLTDALPAAGTYQSATPSQGSCVHAGGSPGGTLTCALGDLPTGSSAIVELIVKAPTFGTTMTNSASVAGNEADPNSSNDSDSETTTVVTNANRLCYAVADSGNILTEVDTADFNPATNETTVGSVGVSNIEAIAYDTSTGILYAANLGQFGSLSLTTGAFNFIGNFGTGNGSLGSVTFSDVDALAYDATTGVMYGVTARSGTDALFQINMATGAHVPNAFGAGVDYVAIPPILSNSITDDIAVDPTTGVMYASVNSGGSSDRLIIINKATGATTDVALITVPDIEGLGTDFSGQLWGTSGTQNVLYEIDKATGVGSSGRPLDNGGDYEAVDCYAVSPSITVDISLTKVVSDATPDEGDTIDYTVTVNNAGPSVATALQISDPLPTGVTFSSATPTQGIYDALTGNWYIGSMSVGGSATLTLTVTVDAGTSGSTISNTASLAFVSQTDINSTNDSATADIVPAGGASLMVLKSVSTVRDPTGAVAPAALAIPGAVVEYEVSVSNSGGTAADELVITDAITAELTFLAGEYDGGAADVEIIIGAAAPVFCIAEIAGDTNSDGCFLNATGDDLTVSIPVSVTYPTGITVGTTAPDNTAVVHFRATVN